MKSDTWGAVVSGLLTFAAGMVVVLLMLPEINVSGKTYCTYVFANQPTAADTLAVVMADSTAFCERFLH